MHDLFAAFFIVLLCMISNNWYQSVLEERTVEEVRTVRTLVNGAQNCVEVKRCCALSDTAVLCVEASAALNSVVNCSVD